ncbi:MAG: DUF5717 family protein [Lachnospiraceae bacterium]|nr:DUF5717 family protein [Lachnospiraceae bacterium]
MIRQIEEMAKGNIEMERPSVELSAESLVFDVPFGGSYEGDFVISTQGDSVLEADILCFNHNVTELRNSVANGNVKISFVYRAQSLKVGDTDTGSFFIVTNGGEFQINFSARVIGEKIIASTGEIASLSDFTRLYEINPKEAEAIYKSDAFSMLLTNTKNRLYYRKIRSVEEFLIAASYKKRAMFTVDRNVIRFSELLGDEYTESILLRKKEFGKIGIKASTDSDFVHLDKEYIREDDFVAGEYRLSFTIDRERLYKGENTGRIVLENNFQREVITVNVSVVSEVTLTREDPTGDKKFNLRLSVMYEEYLAGIMVTGAWVTKTIELIKSYNSGSVRHELYKAYVMMINKQMQDFRTVVDALKTRTDKFDMRDSMLFGCLLYLVETDEKKRETIFAQISDIYANNMDDSFIRYCMLLPDAPGLDEKIRLSMIIRWIKDGENSPFFYANACKILNKYPFYLTDLKPEMLKILNWGVKKKVIGKALCDQLVSVYGVSAGYSKLVDRIITGCYEMFPSKDTLGAVCQYRIKGDLRREADHELYRRAIEQDIKLGGLYEYFVASLSKTHREEIPRQVAIYFRYNNSLTARQKAALYVNILAAKDSDHETYDNYRDQIHDFVLREMKEGLIDDNLSVLYNATLEDFEMDKEFFDALSRTLYMNRLVCTNPAAKVVHVISDSLSEIFTYQIDNGIAFIPVYPGEYVTVLGDRDGRVFVDNDACELERLFNPARYVRSALNSGSVKLPYALHHMLGKSSFQGLNDQENEILKLLLESPHINSEYKEKLTPAVIKNTAGGYSDDELLSMMDMKKLDESVRSRYASNLVYNRFYDRAYEFVEYFGPGSIKLEELEEIILYKVNGVREYDEKLARLMIYAVSNGSKRYAIFKYLCVYMEGTVDQLYAVWREADKNGIDVTIMTEKILYMMIFTGEMKHFAGKLFSRYLKGKHNIIIEKAYTFYFAYRFIVKRMSVDADVFMELEKFFMDGEELPDYAKLALIRYYSETGVSGNTAKHILDELLYYFTDRKIYFDFYKDLPEEFQVRYHLYDRYIVTCISDSEAVELMYRFDDSGVKKLVVQRTLYGYHTAVLLSAGTGELMYYFRDNEGRNVRYGRNEYASSLKSVPNNLFYGIQTGENLIKTRAMSETTGKLFNML